VRDAGGQPVRLQHPFLRGDLTERYGNFGVRSIIILSRSASILLMPREVLRIVRRPNRWSFSLG
jgi:hypothetical protein